MSRPRWFTLAPGVALLLVVLLCLGVGSAVGAQTGGVLAALRAGRGSLALALLVLSVSLPLGTLLGAAAAGGPRLFDALLARIVELCGVLPSVVAIAVLARSSTPFVACAVILSALRSVETARLVRGELLRIGAEPFAVGARALGLSHTELVFRHALPHLADSLKLSAALTLAYVVATEAALGFLGLPGAGRNMTWGTLLGGSLDGRGYAALALVLMTTGASYWLARATPRGPWRSGEPLANAAQKSR